MLARLRSAWPWFLGSTAFAAACAGTVIWATRITIPPLGCTVPQPRADVAAWTAAATRVDYLVGVADRLAIAGLIVTVVGIAISRSRGFLILYTLPYLLVVVLATGYGHDITGGNCNV